MLWWKVKTICSCWENVMRIMGIDFLLLFTLFNFFVYTGFYPCMTWEMDFFFFFNVLRNFLFFETKPRQDITWRGHKSWKLYHAWVWLKTENYYLKFFMKIHVHEKSVKIRKMFKNWKLLFENTVMFLMRLDSTSFLSYRWPCSAIIGQAL